MANFPPIGSSDSGGGAIPPSPTGSVQIESSYGVHDLSTIKLTNPNYLAYDHNSGLIEFQHINTVETANRLRKVKLVIRDKQDTEWVNITDSITTGKVWSVPVQHTEGFRSNIDITPAEGYFTVPANYKGRLIVRYGISFQDPSRVTVSDQMFDDNAPIFEEVLQGRVHDSGADWEDITISETSTNRYETMYYLNQQATRFNLLTIPLKTDSMDYRFLVRMIREPKDPDTGQVINNLIVWWNPFKDSTPTTIPQGMHPNSRTNKYDRILFATMEAIDTDLISWNAVAP